MFLIAMELSITFHMTCGQLLDFLLLCYIRAGRFSKSYLSSENLEQHTVVLTQYALGLCVIKT